MTDAEKIKSLETQCDKLRAKVDSTMDDWMQAELGREDAEEHVESLSDLLDQAKEHVPEIAVYGIDHRAIEEVLRG